MPAPGRLCPECSTVVPGGGRCPAHARGQWRNVRGEEPKRIRGRKLQRMRADLFRRHPLCEPCEAAGRTTLAILRDHRIPLAEGGTDDAANEQAICFGCHQAKTQAEAQRGADRAR